MVTIHPGAPLSCLLFCLGLGAQQNVPLAAWIDRLADPVAARAAARELTQLGGEAVPILHRALVDKRSEVAAAALWVVGSLHGDLASLRAPIERCLRGRQLGPALAAMVALPALDGGGHTLLADYAANAVFDVAPDGDRAEVLTSGMVMSAQRLPDGHLVFAAYKDNRVVEVDAEGEEVWSFADLEGPCWAERLPNGHTLIADAGHQRAIEVDRAGDIVWSYDEQVRPVDIERLGNGNTLICSYQQSGVIEVSPAGKVVWQWEAENVRDADRLIDGTTLLVDTPEERVLLVAVDKSILREWRTGFSPTDAELLANGHLVAAGDGQIREWDHDGKEVWSHRIQYAGGFRRLGLRR